MNSDETPTNNRVRRSSGELDGEKLTNFRLKSLEESVERLTEQVAMNNGVLGEINARLLVGNERHSSYDKRLESLERDRRWTALGIITAAAGLVWQAITAMGGKHMMVLLALSLLLCACWDRGLPQVESGSCGPACTTLVGIGTYATWAGSAAITLGTLAIVASFLPWTAFLAVFRSLFAEVIALGFAAVLVGTSLIWLGDHLYLLVVACGLVLVWLGYRYRAWLVRFLAFKPDVAVSRG